MPSVLDKQKLISIQDCNHNSENQNALIKHSNVWIYPFLQQVKNTEKFYTRKLQELVKEFINLQTNCISSSLSQQPEADTSQNIFYDPMTGEKLEYDIEKQQFKGWQIRDKEYTLEQIQ